MKVKKKNHVFFSHHCEIYQFSLSRSKLKLHSKTKKTKSERSERKRERERNFLKIETFTECFFLTHTLIQYTPASDEDENTRSHTQAHHKIVKLFSPRNNNNNNTKIISLPSSSPEINFFLLLLAHFLYFVLIIIMWSHQKWKKKKSLSLFCSILCMLKYSKTPFVAGRAICFLFAYTHTHTLYLA
jgi:hypothetical protein